MKIFNIRSDMGHVFEFQNQAHPNYKGILIPHASIHALHGGFGDFVFQHVYRPYFDLWYSNYLTRQRFKTCSWADLSLIELSIVIENNVSYRLANPIGKVHQKAGQFNLFNSLAMDSTVQFEKSALYTTLDIHLQPKLVELLFITYPKLMEPLINAIAAGRDCMFYTRPLYLTPQMTELVDLILALLKAPVLDAARLDQAVISLLTHAIVRKLYRSPKFLSNKRQAEIREQLNDLLMILRTDKVFRTIPEYAKIAGMSATTLKKYFQEVFGLTIKQYWDEVRLTTAHHQLLHTDRNLEEIALDIGFADGSSLSKAFKRVFHHLPSVLRTIKNLKA